MKFYFIFLFFYSENERPKKKKKEMTIVDTLENRIPNALNSNN
jgi:hypothetical protein